MKVTKKQAHQETVTTDVSNKKPGQKSVISFKTQRRLTKPKLILFKAPIR